MYYSPHVPGGTLDGKHRCVCVWRVICFGVVRNERGSQVSSFLPDRRDLNNPALRWYIVSCTGSMTDLGKTYVLRHVSPKDAYVQGYTTLYTAKDTGSWCVSFPRTRYICVSFPSTRLMNRSKAQPYLKSTKCMRRGMAVWRIRSEIRVVLFSWPLRGSRLALQTLHPRRFLPSLPALRACIIGCTCTNALPAQARTAIDEQSLLLAHSSDAVLVSSATVSELISY
jgi:hypothetical protein